jgi:hypothetical protein
MTRVMSAANLAKNYPRGAHRPADGTKLRRLYDLFLMYKGLAAPNDTIELICGRRAMDMVEQLMDFYGLDIRKFPASSRGERLPRERRMGPPKKALCLVGEWKDGKYCDYLAERGRR